MTVKHQDKVADLRENSLDKLSVNKFASNINDKNNFTTPTSNKLSKLGSSLDTRQLSKESSWNFMSSDNILENMEYTMSVMKLDSPKILSKPTFENKIKDDSSHNDRMDSEEYLRSISPIYNILAPDNLSQKADFSKLNDVDSNSSQMQDLDESDLNLLTNRSIKTELLLKPTEEISLHLKQSSSYSRLNNKKLENCKEDFSFKSTVDRGIAGSDESSCESTDSIEKLGTKSKEVIKPQNIFDSTCKFETKLNDMNDSMKSLRVYSESIPIGFEKNDSMNKESYQCGITTCTDSSVEDCQSNFTDLSLGQKIVKKCRSNSSASTGKSHESFIPPQRKQTNASIQNSLVSNDSPTTSDKPSYRTPNNKQRKIPDVQSKGLKQNTRSSTRERSSTELSVKGRSFSGKLVARELDWQHKGRAKQKLENASQIKMEKVYIFIISSTNNNLSILDQYFIL